MDKKNYTAPLIQWTDLQLEEGIANGSSNIFAPGDTWETEEVNRDLYW